MHTATFEENTRCVVLSDSALDGVKLYEVEFKSKGYEYSYEIDALSGKVLKHEKVFDD